MAGVDAVLARHAFDLFGGVLAGVPISNQLTEAYRALPTFAVRGGLDVTAARPFTFGFFLACRFVYRELSEIHDLEAGLRLGLAF